MIQEVVSAVRPLADETSGPDERGRGKLLVVDDNALNRDLLARHLQREGHSVSLAEDGRLALAMIQAEPFDLVLLDLIMPEMNGYEVLQHLKGDAARRDIPVIIISALDELDSVVRCLEAGAEDYLSKPFNPVVLRARIGASLEKKRLRDAEIEYLRNVAVVTDAAGAVEAGVFIPDDLADSLRARRCVGQVGQGLPTHGGRGLRTGTASETAGSAAHDRVGRSPAGAPGGRDHGIRLLPAVAGNRRRLAEDR